MMPVGIMASGRWTPPPFRLWDTFTAVDGTLVTDRAPDAGVYSQVPTNVSIWGGAFHVGYNNNPTMSGQKLLVTPGTPNVQANFTYTGIKCRDGLYIHGAFFILAGSGSNLTGVSFRPETNLVDLVNYTAGTWTSIQQVSKVLNVARNMECSIFDSAVTVKCDGETLISHTLAGPAEPPAPVGFFQPVNALAAGVPRAQWILDNLEIVTL